MTDARLARPPWRGRTNVDALTIACIERAEQVKRDRFPEVAHLFTITQGSYQAGAGDPNSAGTHDEGGVVDTAWCGHADCVRALRLAGMAAWHRTPAQGPWPDHVHAVVLGHPLLAPLAAQQVQAYLAGRNGLANNGPDDGPRLDPIPRPVWPWPQEEDMAWNDDLPKVNVPDDKPGDTLTAGQSLAQARGFAAAAYASSLRAERAVAALAKALGPEVEAAVLAALKDAVVNVNVTVGGDNE